MLMKRPKFAVILKILLLLLLFCTKSYKLKAFKNHLKSYVIPKLPSILSQQL